VTSPPSPNARSRALPAGHALRELHDADADELHALIESNRARLARWIQWAHEQTLQDTRAFIGRARAMEQDGSGHSRAIVRSGSNSGSGSGHLAGVVGITVDRANRSAAIGYWLDEDSGGKGVMTAGVAAVVEDGFYRYRLVRVEIRADVRNRASRAIPERLGFQLEGVMRQSYHVAGERFSDDAVYSLLASDGARAALGGRAAVA
jgi:ribosomal-protein-serine acetyltransferase